MFATAVPLHNISLAETTRIPLAAGFTFQDVPAWLREDEQVLARLSAHDREGVRLAKHALVSEYEVSALDTLDPDWTGKNPRPLSDRKLEEAIMANLALWLEMPSRACFTCIFHAKPIVMDGGRNTNLLIMGTGNQTPLYCHEKDLRSRPSYKDIIRAKSLHEGLTSIRRETAVWTAARAFWSALTSNAPDIRYSLLWIALEALFGPDSESGEITHRLSQRVAFFLANNPHDARALYKKGSQCYRMRSQIVHGRMWDSPKLDTAMFDTEAIIRTVFRKLALNSALMAVFQSKKRDEFLTDWVFSRETDPPPFPV